MYDIFLLRFHKIWFVFRLRDADSSCHLTSWHDDQLKAQSAYFIYDLPIKQVMQKKLLCFRALWLPIVHKYLHPRFFCHDRSFFGFFCFSFSIFTSSLQWDLRTVCWRSHTVLLFLRSSVTLQHPNRRCLQSTFLPWLPPTRPATSFHPPMGLWEAR